ncbi:MAG: hypothetical protein NVS3B7_19110 [Candidatus Elarobacter sp.]
MKIRLAVIILAASLAGCSGGGNTTSTPGGPTKLNATFRGTSSLAAGRSTQALAGTSVSVSYNGSTVSSGTLDGNGHAAFTLPSVPRGARVQLSAGSVRPTILLATKTSGTIAQVTVNPNSTLSVTSTDDVNEDGTANDKDDENQQNDVEDVNGVVTSPSPAPSPSPSSSASPSPLPSPSTR